MPVTKGAAGRNMGPLNKDLKEEIKDDIIAKVSIGDVCRTADSIKKSANFHLDSRKIGEIYKVEIQYQKGSKQTVAVVQTSPDASTADLRTGLTNSMKDGYIYEVT